MTYGISSRNLTTMEPIWITSDQIVARLNDVDGEDSTIAVTIKSIELLELRGCRYSNESFDVLANALSVVRKFEAWRL